MAQNVESNVNIKVNADTGQAVSAIDNLWKAYSMLNDITLSLNKNASSLDSKSIIEMRESYIQLADALNAYNQYGLITEKQTETFANAFNKYKVPYYAEQKQGFFGRLEIKLMIDLLNI